VRFRNTSYEMTEGETNRFTIDFRPVAGANSLTDLSVAADGLTFASVGYTGLDGSGFVSGGQAGRDYIVTIAAELSSGETKVGAVIFEWKAPGYDFRQGRI
jgi:hypothetical protein